MLVFWKERLTFLAVPKTGTSAFAAALGSRADMIITDPPELKHAPVYRYNRFFRPMFERNGAPDMELMAVMREPISWLGSWYRYRQRPFMKGRENATHEISFDEFVQAYCRGDRPGFANVGSQFKFLEPQKNGTHVQHLFAYENQAKLVAFLEDRLGCDIALDRVNVSPSAALELNPGTEAKLRRKFPEDFDLWQSIR